ncbi:DUF6538 domain-containing protein [Pseudomonas sp. BN102]|uniref:DUF6538 domain-containing protein n=1 Tax=Pseudomonas sp. BN102 TaxID=2567886 RepID=UPI0024570F78|nr:DUF6538 domain-containing protein [Pseudomonas sp. BN102]MDH4611360.1 integrase [Pseudomonas sp. BN102]
MPPASSKPNATQNHLLLRGSVYHCRIDIPADLRPAFAHQRILSKSLKTGDKRLARELASVQVGQWKVEFRAIREAKARAGDRWREELAEAAKAHHENADRTLLSAIKGTFVPSNRPTPTLDEFSDAVDRLTEEKKSLFAYVGQLEQELGIPGLKDEVGAIWSDDSLSPAEKLRRYSEVQQQVLAHKAKADYHLNGSEMTEALTLARTPSTYKPRSPISSTSIDRFSEFYLTQNDNVRTRDVYVSKVQKLSQWLTTNGRELNFDAVADFLDSVSRKRQTRTGYIAAWQRYHEWASRYDTYYRGIYADAKNPFDRHTHPIAGDGKGQSWDFYKREQAERLHAAALAKGDTDLADLIAFACYTGCRIEELGRIRRETTEFDASETPISFKVDDAKTKAGIREVPIHSALLPLYVKRLSTPQGNNEFLFPGNDSTKHGLRLGALSQRFTKLKRAEGFGNLHVFHSFRRCTVTQLHQNGADQSVMPYIIGHEVGLLTFDLYSDGPEFEKKKEAIEKLKFNFKLD